MLLPFTLWGKITENDLRYVMPAATAFSVKYGKYPHWDAYKGDEFIGICYITTDIDPTIKGYAGPIKILVGLYKNRTISGIKVISHTENIPQAYRITEDWFQLQFTGKDIAEPFIVGKDIQGITGATVSAKSVALAVKKTARIMADYFFPLKRKEVFTESKTETQKFSPKQAEKEISISYTEKKFNPTQYMLVILIFYILLCIGINFKLRKNKKILFVVFLFELLLLIVILKFFKNYKNKVSIFSTSYNPGHPQYFKEKILTQPSSDISGKPLKSTSTKTEEILILKPKWGIGKINKKDIEKQIKSGNLSGKEAYNYREVK